MSRELTLLSAVALLGATSSAYAQKAAEPASPAPSAEVKRAVVEEIIVTAQRREENIQDVPISIVAVSAEQLEDAGVDNLKDLAFVTSGVNFTDGYTYVFPIIRGVGSFVRGSSSSASVAVYFDGAYMPRMTSTALDLDNIQSVEILKGPQSTLYGRNATGGAINVNTQTTHPGDPLSGRAALTAGEFNQRKASFFVASGLGDMFAINASGYWLERDGYVRNLAPFNLDSRPGAATPRAAECADGLDSACEYAAAVKLTFTPNQRTEISLSLRGSEYEDTASSGSRQLSPATANAALSAIGLFGPGPFTFATDYGTSYGHSNRRRGSDYGLNLTGSYDADDLTFTSITAYSITETHTSTDLLAASIPTFGFDGIQPSKVFSQELRVLSTFDSRLNWLAGVNYFLDDSDPDVDLASIVAGNPFVGQSAEARQTAVAAFGEVYFDVTDALRLTTGLRYTSEKTRAVAVFDIFGIVPPGTTVRVEDDALTYRAVLDYDMSWGLLYGSVATGYKSGGQNATNLAGAPFDPEEITSYEIGAKSNLFNGQLRLNSSIFVYKFEGIQTSLTGGPTGGAQYFVNGDQAEISGVEVDFDSRITEKFSLWGSLTYLAKREYTDFLIPADPVVGIPAIDATGNKLFGAPEWSSVLGVRYEQSLGTLGELLISTNLSHHSGYFVTVENNIGTGGLNDAAPVTLLNGQIEIKSSSGIGVALWGRNLTDEKYVRDGLSALGGATVLGVDGQPREFGVTVTYEF